MIMRKDTTFKALLFAGALVLAAGCGKDVFSQKYSRNAGDPVVFGVRSGVESETRTVYREGTTVVDGKTIQSIDWVANDNIRIYSPDAKRAAWNYPEQWADYTVKNIQQDGTMSKGQLSNVQAFGLAWGDAGNHTFYAIYPSPNTTEANVPNGSNGILALTIPAAQAETAEMEYAYMTAAAQAEAGVSGDAVNLYFYPAFTAFEFQIIASEPTIFHDFELVSTTDNLAGAATVTYTGVTPAYACASNVKKITVDLDDKSLAQDESFTFIVFAAPTDLTGLTIRFTVSSPSTTPGVTNPTRTNSLALKYGSGAQAPHTPGEYITFAGRKKHILKSVATPYSTDLIEVNSIVMTADLWQDQGTETIDVIP